MTLFLVILLAAAWGGLFLPALLRARQSTSPIVSVSMFRSSMRALGAGRSGRWVVMPLDPEERVRSRRVAIVRRRKTFVALLWVAAISLILGLLPSLRFMLTVHLFADVALAGFIGFLIMARRADVADAYRPRHRAGAEDEPEDDYELAQASQF